MKNWAKLPLGLLLLFVAGLVTAMLADPALMNNNYFSTLTAVPVGAAFVLAVGAGDPSVQARRRLAKEQRQIRARAEQTLAEWDKKYGPSVVTPVQKPKALPVCTTPPVTGATSPVIGGSMTTDQFIRQVAKAAEESYVPEGSAELQANLLEALRDQAAEGVKGSHWEMNAEWAAEVKKIKVIDGNGNRGKLWEPRTRVMPPGYPDVYLLGFPVRVSDEYGAPSLEAP